MSFQWRLISSFSFMGFLVLIVGFMGWNGNSRLSNHISTLANINLLSIDSLWKIKEGQTQIESAQRILLNSDLTPEQRQNTLVKIKESWQQITEGLKQFESTPYNNKEEENLRIKFYPIWERWKQSHQEFMQIEEEYTRMGIRNPWKRELELIRQNQDNSSEMGSTKAALAKYIKLHEHTLHEKNVIFKQIDEVTTALLKNNQNFAKYIYNGAEKDVAISTFLISTATVVGPLLAILLGILISRQIATQVIRVVGVAEQISTGDLTTQLSVDSNQKDEIGKLLFSFQTMIQNLNILIRQVQQSGIEVTTSATQIAASGKQLEATMTEQVASTNEVAATAKEISATSRELVKTMEEVALMSQTTTTATSSSQKDLLRMEATMRQLGEATNIIASRLGTIGEKANNINNIVVMITKVADQTNLLSLNAAIEAEKAGEYGLGFAVVAREIRRLADQTAVATLEIEKMVKQMQSSVSAGVMEMDKFAKEVGQSVADVANISGQMSHIIEQVQELTPRFEAVNSGMEAQSQGAQQISDAMVQLSNTSIQTTDSLREINNAITRLNQVARGLRQEITRFQVKTDNSTQTLPFSYKQTENVV
ncbi:methyl-accepting chemotaxis protein [Scytonema tolypothrichoides VB-61278_2]